ncbi:hypothetical protein JET18_10435 [Chryseobacterium sp. L7]|uniref:Uncharacterized protein n=1 Tax=Chryseobacterium endalhagicum TaxID=2797638 RepID=A0ABS1QF69_9FLAO|nr:hypothetical protein [Chryseobacterium endalhagicum]MBL1221258.1 hypothetical protein [Chryseobacterium endalhagicum]
MLNWVLAEAGLVFHLFWMNGLKPVPIHVAIREKIMETSNDEELLIRAEINLFIQEVKF